MQSSISRAFSLLRVTSTHGPRNEGAVRQHVQVRGNVGTVLRAVRCIAPAATRVRRTPGFRP
jgi:hypothetical protein